MSATTTVDPWESDHKQARAAKRASDSVDPMVDEDLLKELVVGLVDEPESVRITVKENDQGKLLVIHCAVDDRGKVIGKSGCNIQAICTLFRSMGNFDGGRRLLVALENLALKEEADVRR